MISDKLNCIFIHVPKTGGTSIEDVLWPGVRKEADLWMGFVDNYHNKYQTGGLQHLLARQIRQEVGLERFCRCYRFAFVRNPWDRTVSQYASMKTRDGLRAFIGMKGEDSFARYVGLIQEKKHVQWAPQSEFLYDESGDLLVNFVGRFEHLEEHARMIFGELGVACGQLPHRRRSQRSDYAEYYDGETKRLIAQLYESDIDTFNYAFETKS